MQHHHKLHCGPHQNICLSFLIWSINQRLSSLCAADEELECVDTEGPVVCWESLGLPDLDCDEKPGWISNSCLAGELIQPGPQEVWTQPTHERPLLQRGGFWETRSENELWKLSRGRTAMGQSETLVVTGTRTQICWWPVLSQVILGKESNCKRLKMNPDGEKCKEKMRALLKDKNFIPLEGRLS